MPFPQPPGLGGPGLLLRLSAKSEPSPRMGTSWPAGYSARGFNLSAIHLRGNQPASAIVRLLRQLLQQLLDVDHAPPISANLVAVAIALDRQPTIVLRVEHRGDGEAVVDLTVRQRHELEVGALQV